MTVDELPVTVLHGVRDAFYVAVGLGVLGASAVAGNVRQLLDRDVLADARGAVHDARARLRDLAA